MYTIVKESISSLLMPRATTKEYQYLEDPPQGQGPRNSIHFVFAHFSPTLIHSSTTYHPLYLASHEHFVVHIPRNTIATIHLGSLVR